MGITPGRQYLRVREKATGRVFDAEPVDGREIVNHEKGEYEYAPDADLTPGTKAKAPAAPKPAKAATAKQRLEAMSHKELKALAKRAGLDAKGSKDELVTALVPQVKAGAVALDAPAPLATPPTQFPHLEE